MSNAAIGIVEVLPGQFQSQVFPSRDEAIAWVVRCVSDIGGVEPSVVDATYNDPATGKLWVTRTVFVVSDDTPVSGMVFGPHAS